MPRRKIRGVTKEAPGYLGGRSRFKDDLGRYADGSEIPRPKGREGEVAAPLAGSGWGSMSRAEARQENFRAAMSMPLGTVLIAAVRRYGRERLAYEVFEESGVTELKLALDNLIRIMYPQQYRELQGKNWESIVSTLGHHFGIRFRDSDLGDAQALERSISTLLMRIEEVVNQPGGYARY